MDDALLSKEAVILARNSSPKRAIRDLMKFIIEIGLNNQPEIRLSDRGALLVAARIMQDYANYNIEWFVNMCLRGLHTKRSIFFN